jgi:hypothetical protein
MALSGCASVVSEDDLFQESGEEIVDVENSAVKRQSIGNCWLYATASWAESINKSATGVEMNMSESYWTYWHWYEQIVAGRAANEISTGGHFSTATSIIRKYGVMLEKDFIPSESEAEMSARQASALAAINTSIKSGALKTSSARANKQLVRKELDKAWGLSRSVVAQLDQFVNSGSGATFTTNLVKRASSIPVQYSRGPGSEPGKPTLKRATLYTATTEWRLAQYPWTATERRNFQKRFQKALHDRQPVVMSWFVDFNALDEEGRFFAPPATPGRQGGHMVVMEDYQINNVPGFGTLAAGVAETRSAALTAALDSRAAIEFIRVKNSWGSYRPDRAFALPGFHDLYMKYLNGPVRQCEEKDGVTDPNNCYDDQAFNDVVLPPGY